MCCCGRSGTKCVPADDCCDNHIIRCRSETRGVLSQFQIHIGTTTRAIDPSHKSRNALGKYPTMHHLVTEMCTLSVTKWCMVGCGTGAIWDLCNKSIGALFTKGQ